MVRFIIINFNTFPIPLMIFTFQYGQIYYREAHAHAREHLRHLHSNMVRFIIIFLAVSLPASLSFTFQYGQIYYIIIEYQALQQTSAFTFQYGQIYYLIIKNNKNNKNKIYIPIWLDLLLAIESMHLINAIAFTFQYGQIYYHLPMRHQDDQNTYLHSNMVRFII